MEEKTDENPTCAGGHTLQWSHAPGGYNCDKENCDKDNFENAFGCRICNFDLCYECYYPDLKCAIAQRKLKCEKRCHTLKQFLTVPQNKCDKCLSTTSQHSLMFGCTTPMECQTMMCQGCQTKQVLKAEKEDEAGMLKPGDIFMAQDKFLTVYRCDKERYNQCVLDHEGRILEMPRNQALNLKEWHSDIYLRGIKQKNDFNQDQLMQFMIQYKEAEIWAEFWVKRQTKIDNLDQYLAEEKSRTEQRVVEERKRYTEQIEQAKQPLPVQQIDEQIDDADEQIDEHHQQIDEQTDEQIDTVDEIQNLETQEDYDEYIAHTRKIQRMLTAPSGRNLYGAAEMSTGTSNSVNESFSDFRF